MSQNSTQLRIVEIAAGIEEQVTECVKEPDSLLFNLSADSISTLFPSVS